MRRRSPSRPCHTRPPVILSPRRNSSIHPSVHPWRDSRRLSLSSRRWKLQEIQRRTNGDGIPETTIWTAWQFFLIRRLSKYPTTGGPNQPKRSVWVSGPGEIAIADWQPLPGPRQCPESMCCIRGGGNFFYTGAVSQLGFLRTLYL